MTANSMPQAEIPIDDTTVRGLLERQAPQFAAATLRELASGWDNAIFRLGDELVVRVPRRAVAAGLVEHEQRWLPVLAPQLELPIPVPVFAGRADEGFPWPWSVVAFQQGTTVAESSEFDQTRGAEQLGVFLRALHREAPSDAPVNPYRGVPLTGRATVTQRQFDAARDQIDVVAATELWEACLAVPYWADAPVWLHGDLHPANVVCNEGVITAVIDFGDICGGDPATDLAAAWMFFDREHRTHFREQYGNADRDLWQRARGWALAHSIACLANSADNPRMHRVGAATYAAVIADPHD